MRRALVNGAAGAVATLEGEPYSVGAITVRNRKIVAIDILADPERLARLDLTILDDSVSREAGPEHEEDGADGPVDGL